MEPLSSVFALSDRLAAKADPTLIEVDEAHLAAVATTLQEATADLSARLDTARRATGGTGQAALDRDLEIHRLTTRLRLLSRFGLDLCLGRVVGAGATEPLYIGRLGLSDRSGNRLLVDWRTPAAEPFFAATHGNPMGLISRRRYRWSEGRISDYWDEAFTADGLQGHAALDETSAFLASLGEARTPQMRDVLATIAADQDAVVRASSRGTVVVDGGPGTGKTVVALHRSAYLLHSDPRIASRGGVLLVGPHEPYLAYVGDVLPGLGEDSVRMCTLRSLVKEGAEAVDEADPDVAQLKASLGLVEAVEQAIRVFEEPPTDRLVVSTEYADVQLEALDWAEAFDAAEPGTPHNEARQQVWDALLDLLVDRTDADDAPSQLLRRSFGQDESLRQAFNRAWPILEATDLVGDLWSVPALLRVSAPQLSREQVRALQRDDPQAWTVSDLPLLDAARQRLGDPDTSRARRRRQRHIAEEQERMDRVVDTLIEADDGEGLVTMLRHQDLQYVLVDEAAPTTTDPDQLAGPFAHVVVDEAQELTDAQWAMLLRRCPSRSLTVAGDRTQARQGFTETWQERLGRVGLDGVGPSRVQVETLTINYRTPTEVMTEAEPVIRAVLPDANVPVSLRSTGAPVVHGSVTDLTRLLEDWLARHPDGIGCVIGDATFPGTPRVRSLTPQLAKGLEFDLVVLVDPQALGTGLTGAVDRYVAMTRATQQLVVLDPARPHTATAVDTTDRIDTDAGIDTGA